MNNELAVELDVPRDVAEACLESIRPEIDADVHTRSEVTLKYDGRLTLLIRARDLHALRAAANTYFRWLDMCLKIAR